MKILQLLAAILFTSAVATRAADKPRVIIITIDGGAAFYLKDPKAPIPNLKKIATEGVAADGMKVVNPAVTWPNHTTLVTGVSPAKHGLLYNGLMVPNKNGGFSRNSEASKMQLVVVPTIYDFLHKKGFSTAAINWPATQGAKTLDFCMPDLHRPLPYSTPQFIKELTEAKILDDSSPDAFLKTTAPRRDQIWSDAACYLLRTHQPDFMLLHFLISDSTQHRYGPQTPEAYEALKIVDRHIGEVFDTLEKTGLRDSTSVIITADHGFARFDKQIVPSTILRNASLLEIDGKTRVEAVTEGGTAMIYFRAKKTKKDDYKKVIELFENQEGIAKIIEPKDYAKYGYPSPKKNPQMSDLVLVAKDDYSFSGLENSKDTIVASRPGGSGSHGYLAENPKMNALFIATGRGIAKGKHIGIIRNLDVAPTAAYLLGEKLPGADGKVLKEILANP